MNNFVHIFKASLSNFCDLQEEDALSLLDEYEIVRFHSFKDPNRQNMFLLSRYFLKNTLKQQYEILNPKISVQENGKPYLSDSPLKISLSHSKDQIMLGISNLNIGVDIEFCDTNRNIKDFLDHFMSEKEKKWIEQNLKNIEKRFYILWSLKEAVVKFKGSGIFNAKNIDLTPILNSLSDDLKYETSIDKNYFKNPEINKMFIIYLGEQNDFLHSVCLGML